MTKTYLEPNEIEQLESVAIYQRDKLLIRLLFRLGCRVSEALGLEVKDIDFGHSTVTIQHLKSRIKLACPKCNARLRKSHAFCPGCGAKVEEAVAKEHQQRKMRNRVKACRQGGLKLYHLVGQPHYYLGESDAQEQGYYYEYDERHYPPDYVHGINAPFWFGYPFEEKDSWCHGRSHKGHLKVNADHYGEPQGLESELRDDRRNERDQDEELILQEPFVDTGCYACYLYCFLYLLPMSWAFAASTSL